MAPQQTALAGRPSAAAALALALLPALARAECSRVDESCLHTGCCETPKTSCFKKNDEAAFCRLGCEPGLHMDDPKEFRTPWSCDILTFGCAVEWQPCEGAQGQGDVVPCCQTGCMCNYTSKYFHQCVPPEGENKCSPDGPEKVPDFARAKPKAKSVSAVADDDVDHVHHVHHLEHVEHVEHVDDDLSEKSDEEEEPEEEEPEPEEEEPEEEEPEEEEEDDAGSSSGGSEAGADCIDVGGVMMGPGCQQDKAEVLTDGPARELARAAWRPSRLSLLLAGGGAASGVVAAAAGALLWRRSRRATFVRSDLELSIAEE